MNRLERETVITLNDEEDTVHVFSCQRPVVRRALEHDRTLIIGQGTYADGTPWVRFTAPKEQWSFFTGFKRRSKPMTDEQKKEAAERLAKAREARLND